MVCGRAAQQQSLSRGQDSKMSAKIERRSFLRNVGILAGAAAAVALIEERALAQSTQHASGKPMANPTPIIDFIATTFPHASN